MAEVTTQQGLEFVHPGQCLGRQGLTTSMASMQTIFTVPNITTRLSVPVIMLYLSVIKALQYVDVGVAVIGYSLNNLRFADDIVAMCDNQQGLTDSCRKHHRNESQNEHVYKH